MRSIGARQPSWYRRLRFQSASLAITNEALPEGILQAKGTDEWGIGSHVWVRVVRAAQDAKLFTIGSPPP
ncbi:hypothetical protein PM082_004606 [Marasmius tenuissimus]|nr:hypothetical protein PM082_004606 [Marasmius tenuissimus]